MRTKLLIFALLLSFSLLHSAIPVQSLDAYPQDGKVVIEWSSDNDGEVGSFTVQRSMNGGESWFDVGTVTPYGLSASYIYIDENILGAKSDLVYTYRLKVNNRDGSVVYTQIVSVTMKIASVPMTWGSIKAMFR